MFSLHRYNETSLQFLPTHNYQQCVEVMNTIAKVQVMGWGRFSIEFSRSVGISVLLKLDTVINHFNFNSKHYREGKFA